MKSLFIKNMVCSRCLKVVKEELEKIGLEVEKVSLGEAVILDKEENIDLERIRNVLSENGFELMDDRQAKIVEQIKIAVIEQIHHNDKDLEKVSFSKYLSEKTGLSYQYLSNLFSSFEGITIEKYIINQKIEKVKELLVYDELTLSEISYRLGYSSVQHLSSQFKRVTGFTPSRFKEMSSKNRKPLDTV